MAHGADPFLKNQENQTPLDLSQAEDVRCLLQDAMASSSVPVALASAAPSRPPSIAMAPVSPPPPVVATETVIMPSGAAMTLCVPVATVGSRGSLSPMPEGSCGDSVKGEADGAVGNIGSFLNRLVFIY